VLSWQPSLLDGAGETPRIDRQFAGLVRRDLDATAWVDHVPAWVTGADALFDELLGAADWRAETRPMYGHVVAQPRLSGRWRGRDDQPIVAVVDDMLAALTERYGRRFDRGGLNLYRDGRDSVAWHGDRIAADIVDPVVGIVSLGHPRTFRLRPKGGGRSLGLVVRAGDLVVTGGSCQRTWEHCVPKVMSAGPRISITLRHG
jgi:alkylated DNA repair dioxygenase AlkB